MEQKTIKEWFETLPEPIRSQALENMELVWADRTVADILSAIVYGFRWSKTPEGIPYWDNIHDRALAGEFNTK